MTWLSIYGETIDKETLRHLHSEIKTDRRFWFDKSVAYVGFYSTLISALLSAFLLGISNISALGQYKYLWLSLPLISLTLCIYAMKTIRICYRQFLENTAIMAKLELLLGMYSRVKHDACVEELFPDDNYINPSRYYNNMIRHATMEEYVTNDMTQRNRTYRIVSFVFFVLGILSIVLLAGALYMVLLMK